MNEKIKKEYIEEFSRLYEFKKKASNYYCSDIYVCLSPGLSIITTDKKLILTLEKFEAVIKGSNIFTISSTENINSLLPNEQNVMMLFSQKERQSEKGGHVAMISSNERMDIFRVLSPITKWHFDCYNIGELRGVYFDVKVPELDAIMAVGDKKVMFDNEEVLKLYNVSGFKNAKQKLVMAKLKKPQAEDQK